MAGGILTPCNVACDSKIVTVNSPSGSTLQCDTWLWDDMPLNSPERPPYWNSTSGFDFHHITTVDMSAPVSEILMNRTILDFRDPIMGSLKCTNI